MKPKSLYIFVFIFFLAVIAGVILFVWYKWGYPPFSKIEPAPSPAIEIKEEDLPTGLPVFGKGAFCGKIANFSFTINNNFVAPWETKDGVVFNIIEEDIVVFAARRKEAVRNILTENKISFTQQGNRFFYVVRYPQPEKSPQEIVVNAVSSEIDNFIVSVFFGDEKEKPALDLLKTMEETIKEGC